MNILIYALIGFFLISIESGIMAILPLELFKPDMAIPFIVYPVFFAEAHVGLCISLVLGLFQELFSGAPPGALVFTKVSIFLATMGLKNRFYIESKYGFSCLCGAAIIFESALYLVLALIAKGDTKDLFIVSFYAIPNAIFTGFIGFLIFPLLRKLNASGVKEGAR